MPVRSTVGSTDLPPTSRVPSPLLPGEESNEGGRAYGTRPHSSCPTYPSPCPVTKADLIDRIATGTGLTKIETEAVVNGFMTTVVQALQEGDSVELRGFGSFRAQFRAARTARNPRTKEKVKVAARYVPVFKPSKTFRASVNRALKKTQGEPPA